LLNTWTKEDTVTKQATCSCNLAI